MPGLPLERTTDIHDDGWVGLGEEFVEVLGGDSFGALKEIGACCDSYKACQAGARCISAVTGTGCVLDVSSICAPYVQFNITCFSDNDCEPSRECIGAELCSCGLAGCDGPPVAGTCTLK